MSISLLDYCNENNLDAEEEFKKVKERIIKRELKVYNATQLDKAFSIYPIVDRVYLSQGEVKKDDDLNFLGERYFERVFENIENGNYIYFMKYKK